MSDFVRATDVSPNAGRQNFRRRAALVSGMKSSLLILALAMIGGSAAATPNTPTPAPGPPVPLPAGAPRNIGCMPVGAVLFTIHHGASWSAKGDRHASSESILYASGAWTFDGVLATGKAGRHATGCMAADKVTTIMHLIASVPWTVTPQLTECIANPDTSTTYTPLDKATYTRAPCGADDLDDKSTVALAQIEKLLDAATAPSTPPCCKK